MHDLVFMHFIKPFGHSSHEGFNLFLCEPGHSLVNSGMKLSISEKLKNDVDGVLALEDGFKFHDVGRFKCS